MGMEARGWRMKGDERRRRRRRRRRQRRQGGDAAMCGRSDGFGGDLGEKGRADELGNLGDVGREEKGEGRAGKGDARRIGEIDVA